ncbi:alkaline phosphatase [Chlorobium sp. N1]|uniref:alkaline phosphatase n=1 Tax=Chlorobium sp. N1 TaxID=2491138 RepID=UPI00103C1114|nr:alkaline phosphatase [Chlorobium sp. N1]TCD48154.1 alkaline phosphatase [Chlorobium sp. N1]
MPSLAATGKRALFLALLPALLLQGCSARSAAVQSLERPTARYIFLFIGDGMGLAQLELGRALLDSGDSLAMASLPVAGLAATSALDRYITDSAAAGTALATGCRTTVGSISMAGPDTLRTIVELAGSAGMRTGIVSSVGIDNATPACFYAHSPSRHRYYEIALQMASSGVDYFGGGYAEGNLPRRRARAERDRGDIDSLMQAAGYRIARSAGELGSVRPGTPAWAYGRYDSTAALAFAMDADPGEMELADYTREGIRLLMNPKGFFMMVEGGKIDWACHANDAAAAAHDVLAFDRAVRVALDFWRRHPANTLIVVTADHECGGLSIGNGEGGYVSRPRLLLNQRLSCESFAGKVCGWRQGREVTFPMALDSLRTFFGLGSPRDSLLALSAAERDLLEAAFVSSMEPGSDRDTFSGAACAILNRRAGIGWASRVHTAVPVPVFAVGAGAERFGGTCSNADLGRRLMEAAGLGELSAVSGRSAP